MKKLMFAIAAIAAGVAVADVTSGNIVGYNAANFAGDGQVLRGASFITIGVKDAEENSCVRLSDLKVVGYTGNIEGGVYIAPLKKDGSNQELEFDETMYPIFYFWKDAGASTPAGWYGIDDEPMKDGSSLCGDADDITFPVGQGICFVVESSYTGCALQSAGEVIQSESSYTLPMDGQNLVANPLARAVSLSEITISGYTGNIEGGVYIAPLKKDGSNQELEFDETMYPIFYFWKDAGASTPAGWYGIDDEPMKDGSSLCGDADKIFYQPGEAMCVVVESLYINCSVDFPSLGLTTAE